jgi:hypothetical protein
VISWEELQNNRRPIVPLFNSAHMLDCIKKVMAKYPNAKIETVEDGKLWKLANGGEDLSHPHNSHYACWIEGVMHVTG